MCFNGKVSIFSDISVGTCTDFMLALLNATLSEDGDIMTFSLSPPWAYKTYTSLYIRKAYRDLHDIIWETTQNVVVVGNPGTGKSFFAVYELYIALKERKTVVFQSVPARKTYLFRPGVGAEELPYPNAPTLSEMGPTLLLYDAGTKSEPQFSNICDRIIVFSSPCESSYRDLLKEGATLLCMPTWSWDELEYCAKKLDSYSSMDTTLVRERFTKYGGIARSVLEVNEHTAERHCTEFYQAILHCDTSTLRDTVRAQDRDEVGHKIIHRTVVVKKNGTYDYCHYNFEFASKHVESKVYEVMNQKMNACLMEFLCDCRYEPDLAMVRGSLFKRKAHDLLANGGKFKVHKVEGNKKDKEIEIKSRKKVYFKTLDDVHADDNTYLLPESQNFKAVHAIAPPDTAFQMTAGTSCAIHADEIKHIMEFCKPPPSHRFRLYIVVPDDEFDHFMKMQTYVDDNQKATEDVPPSVDLYALCIPLHN